MYDPVEIEELIKLLSENFSEEEIKDDYKFKRKILRMLRATAIATYYNYHQNCQLRKSISWLKYLVASVLLLIVINLMSLTLSPH